MKIMMDEEREVTQVYLDRADSQVDSVNCDTGDRFNEGKPELSYVMQFRHAVEGMSRVAAFGAFKYSRYNWKKGLDHMEIVDSLLRHLYAYTDGQDEDPETGQLHVDHLSWNALALAEMVRINPEGDSRECVTADYLTKQESNLKEQVETKMQIATDKATGIRDEMVDMHNTGRL